MNKYYKISEKQLAILTGTSCAFISENKKSLYTFISLIDKIKQQPLKPRKLVFKLTLDNIDLKVWECNLGKIRYTIDKYKCDDRYYIYQNHGFIKYYASYNRCVTWIQNHFNQMYEEMTDE